MRCGRFHFCILFDVGRVFIFKGASLSDAPILWYDFMVCCMPATIFAGLGYCLS
jgi:hypothetical protein